MSYGIVDALQKEGCFLDEERDVIAYGIKQGERFILSVIGTLILGFVFGIPLIAAFFLLSFIPLRKYAGGYHAKTSFRCTLISILSISCCFQLINIIAGKVAIEYVICGLIPCIVIIGLLAPVSNSNKSLDAMEIRAYKSITRKILLVESICFFISMLFNANAICYAIMSTIILEAISLVVGYVQNKKITHRRDKI